MWEFLNLRKYLDDVEMVFLGSIIDRILGKPLQNYPGVQVGANVDVSDPAYACNIGLRINVSKTKVM